MSPEMLKGHLDAVILAALDPGEAHGYAIIDAIRRQSRGAFDLAEGTIYPALHRLEQGGLLQSRWSLPDTGRKRRIYSLTASGRASLQSRRESWREFSNAIDSFLRPAASCPT